MLKGLKARVRSVREDLDQDHDPIVTGKLWKAELEVQKAQEAVERSWSRQPSRK